VVTSNPANMTPMIMRAIAFQYFTPKRNAIKLPDHDPDPGRGIATKSIMKNAPYCSNFFLCLSLVFSNSLVNSLSSFVECRRRKSVNGPRSFNIMKFGMMFPIIPIKKADIGSRPMLIPNGIPSRSSTPGSIDPKKVTRAGSIDVSKVIVLI